MRWTLLVMLGACGEPEGSKKDEATAETGQSVTSMHPTTSRGGTTGDPAPVVETHACEGASTYTFEWDATLKYGDTRRVSAWFLYSDWYRGFLEAEGLSDAETPTAIYADGVGVLPDGHLQGVCSFVDAGVGYGAGFVYDEQMLIID